MNDILTLQENMLTQETAWHNIEKSYLIESTKVLLSEADEADKGNKIGEAVKGACDKIKTWFESMMAKAKELWASTSEKVNAKYKKFKEAVSKSKDKPAKSETIEAPVGISEDGTIKTGKLAVAKASAVKLLGQIGSFFSGLKTTLSAWLAAAKAGVAAAAKGTKEALTIANAKKQIAIAKQNLFIAHCTILSKTFAAISFILNKLGAKGAATGAGIASMGAAMGAELGKASKAELKKEEVDLLIEEIEAEIALQESTFDFVDTLLEGKKCCKKEDKEPVEEDEVDEDSEVFDEELADLEDYLGSYED